MIGVLKVAQVGVYFVPFMVGGVEWYMYNISKELVRMGNEVHVFTADSYMGSKHPKEEIIDGIFVHRIPLKLDLTYRFKVWDGLADAIKGINFDIVHAYDYAQPHTPIALKVGKELGSKTFVTVFDIHSMIPRPWYKQIPMRRIEKYFARKVFPLSDKVLVRAPELVPPLIELGVPKDKLVVTPSGILDEALEQADGKRFRERIGIEGHPVILYLGRMNPLKGPQHILEAAPKVLSEFPNAVFLFIGPDQRQYTRKLLSRAKELHIESKVKILGPIYDQKLKMQAYACCDVFVLPTSYEGTSQAIFEAMAQGRPIISTRTGGIPSQITDGKDGLLLPLPVSAEELAQNIICVLSDEQKAITLGKNARSKAESFTYTYLADQLINLYAT